MTSRFEPRLRMAGVVLMLSVFTVGSTTYAQESPEYDTDDLVARGLFDAGRAAYDAGNYCEALNYFQQAHDKSQRPRLLYNIGQTADRLRMDRTALTTFRTYLELVPDAENRREVENRIRALEPLVADDTTAPATVSVAPQEPIAEPSAPPESEPMAAPIAATRRDGVATTNIAPWLLTGGSAAVVITGVVLFVIGGSKISNVEGAPPRSSWLAVRDDAGVGPAYQDAGIAVLALGVVGVAAGVVWIIAGNDADETIVSLGHHGVLVRGTL